MATTMNHCYHCRTEVPTGAEVFGTISGTEEIFCCNGCKAIAGFIVSSGKQEFYSLRGSSTLEPYQEQDLYTKDSLNSEYTYEEYVTGKDIHHREVYITITNIHCSACVWLNEKILSEKKGVKKIRINFASSRAHIVWDDTILQLYDIIETIKSIGYKPVLYSPFKKEKQFHSVTSDLFLRMFVAGFCFGNLMVISTSLYSSYFTGIEVDLKRLFHYLSWVIATPAYLYSGTPFLRSAFYGLKNKTVNMDILLVTGISMAYFYSIYVTISNVGEVYFDSVCMIYFFILFGKYLEALTRENASRKINVLLSKLPEVSTVVLDGVEQTKLSSTIQAGELILISAGERIPVDGELLTDSVYVDESFLTGESKPIIKKKGDKLFAGSLCADRLIYLRATSSYNNSTLSFLQNLVESAMLEKPNIQKFTDKIASSFIKLVLSVAIATFVSWFFYSGIEKAIVNTISVLIVACPCALGLSVPITLVIGNMLLSQKGIIIKNPDLIDILSKIHSIFFDKTGTLTLGNLKVIEEHLTGDKNFIYPLVYSIEKASIHPIATSLCSYLRGKNTAIDNFTYTNLVLKEYAGKGVEGSVIVKEKEHTVIIGNKEYIQENIKEDEISEVEDSEGTILYLLIDGQYIGYWILKDVLRKEAKQEVSLLAKLIPHIKILSGDRRKSVEAVSQELGLTDYEHSLKPEDKLQRVNEAQLEHKKVIMVGDGINDAGALAKADVSITMQFGSDISIDKSDVVLMQNHLSGIRYLLLYSKKTARVIRENVAISFVYNSVMLPLAVMGLMLPVLCAALMTLSSLTVIANSYFLTIRTRRME
jgi:P-type Cu+ transporter